MKISLPPKLDKFVKNKVKEGYYKDSDDLICSALRAFIDSEGAEKIISTYKVESGASISEACFVVLAMAAKDMDDDVKMIMAEIKAMSAAKEKLRRLIVDLNTWISNEMNKHPRNGDKVNNTEVREERTDLADEYVTITDEKTLALIQEHLNDTLDEMSGISEKMTMLLQTVTERRAKIITTLSQILKKLSE